MNIIIGHGSAVYMCKDYYVFLSVYIQYSVILGVHTYMVNTICMTVYSYLCVCILYIQYVRTYAVSIYMCM